MFTLEKEFKFESSHQLMNHDGKCKNLHGHSWKGKLIVEGKELERSGPKKNMLVDYSVIGVAAKEIEKMLDHRHLNDVLHTDMPTSEFISEWIFKKVCELFSKEDWTIMLSAVVIEETCTSRCTFRP